MYCKICQMIKIPIIALSSAVITCISYAQERPFITVDRSQPIGLGSFSVRVIGDFNAGWNMSSQTYRTLALNLGLSKRIEISVLWNNATELNSLGWHPVYSDFSWLSSYLKINILDETKNPIGIATALNIPFISDFYPYSANGPYPAIFLRLVLDKHVKRHYIAVNSDIYLAYPGTYWVSRLGYTFQLKHKNPKLNLGLEGYIFYDIFAPQDFLMFGTGPTFHFEYHKENFLYFLTISLIPESYRNTIMYFDKYGNRVTVPYKYLGGSFRLTAGVRLK